MAGNLPVPPLDLLQALAHAVFQRDALWPRTPWRPCTAMPESLLANAIIGPVEPPDPLGLILIHRKEPALLETALLHADMTSEWMERVVPFLPGRCWRSP